MTIDLRHELSRKRLEQDAQALNKEGILGPRGKSWGPSTINGNKARGTGILNNEIYIGRVVWNRLNYQTHPVTEKRRSRPNSADDLVIVDAPELRIVPQELWDRVKSRQQRMQVPSIPVTAKSCTNAA
ncbi:MAG: recombinase family protein [Hyphomicrobiaceae bacterium]